jgi:signal transduction histidine kinase
MGNRSKLALVTFLTAVRLPLVLLFFVGAIAHSADSHKPAWLFWTSFTALIASAATDLFDGLLARRFGVVSRLGAHADPLMDKFFYLASLPLLVLVSARNGHHAHAVALLSLTLLFLARDQWVTFLRSIGSIYNASGAANWSGKLRTAINFPLVCSVYYYEAAPAHAQWIQPWAIHAFESLGVAVTLISIVSYTHRYWPYLRKAAHPSIGTEAENSDASSPSSSSEREMCIDAMGSGYSHDINNFLAAIGGNASVLLKRLPEDSPVRENALEIKETTDLASALTSDVMKCVGRGEIAAADVHLDSLIRGLEPKLAGMAGPGSSLRMESSGSIPTIKGDAGQLAEAVTHLVRNAFDALSENPGKVVVRTYVPAAFPSSGRTVCVEVSDNGSGMEPALLARATDPFFTTHIRGRGLGLSIAKGIARAHGGSLAIDSKPGEGTTVRILLPA